MSRLLRVRARVGLGGRASAERTRNTATASAHVPTPARMAYFSWTWCIPSHSQDRGNYVVAAVMADTSNIQQDNKRRARHHDHVPTAFIRIVTSSHLHQTRCSAWARPAHLRNSGST